MNRRVLTLIVCCGLPFAGSTADRKDAVPNPAIDMEGYLKVSQRSGRGTARSRRLTEDDFIRMSGEQGTIVLDARSKEKYDLLHVKGAINLSFPDIAVESLKKTLPDKYDPHPDLLQQQLQERRGAVPVEGADGVAEPLDVHRAVQLRLPQHLRTRPADRSEGVEAAV